MQICKPPWISHFKSSICKLSLDEMECKPPEKGNFTEKGGVSCTPDTGDLVLMVGTRPSASSRIQNGGDVVLLYASRYHDVPTVVNVSGRYNLEKGIEERFGEDFMQNIKRDGFFDVMGKTGEVMYRVTEESLMERLGTNMHDACLSIETNCRVLTVHGSSDEIISVEDAYEFDKIIPNHHLHIVEGADHRYSKHKTELAEVVLTFIKASLLPEER